MPGKLKRGGPAQSVSEGAGCRTAQPGIAAVNTVL